MFCLSSHRRSVVSVLLQFVSTAIRSQRSANVASVKERRLIRRCLSLLRKPPWSLLVAGSLTDCSTTSTAGFYFNVAARGTGTGDGKTVSTTAFRVCPCALLILHTGQVTCTIRRGRTAHGARPWRAHGKDWCASRGIPSLPKFCCHCLLQGRDGPICGLSDGAGMGVGELEMEGDLPCLTTD